jgi:MFS family permease
MLIDLSPLIRNRNFRFLYLGQLISSLGSMITYVALPYQIYQMTHSSLAVGMMGIVELAPLLVTALIGGVYADSFDRKKLLIYSEIGLSIGCLLLVFNSLIAHPSVGVIYCVAGMMSAFNGFHRPALESLSPQLVKSQEIPAISSLTALKSLIGTVVGPAIGGLLIASIGIAATYWIDFLSFVISLLALMKIQIPVIQKEIALSPLEGIAGGLQYALSRPELLGSYLVDFIAMIFGMPMALFPAISDTFGGVKTVGLFYAAPSIGAMVATVLSGWTKQVHRNGVAISISATIWGVGITLFGFSSHLWVALPCLMIAGAADAMSGVFRMTLWNQTIPQSLRGRLAGLEMISYTSGPLLGHAESGLVAAAFDTKIAVISGGILCVFGVLVCAILLPQFWAYRMISAENE